MSLRRVLDDAVTRDDVERLLIDAGLRLVALLPRTDVHPAQLVFLARDRRTTAHWVVDDRAGETSVVVDGADAERIHAATAHLSRRTERRS